MEKNIRQKKQFAVSKFPPLKKKGKIVSWKLLFLFIQDSLKCIENKGRIIKNTGIKQLKKNVPISNLSSSVP